MVKKVAAVNWLSLTTELIQGCSFPTCFSFSFVLFIHSFLHALICSFLWLYKCFNIKRYPKYYLCIKKYKDKYNRFSITLRFFLFCFFFISEPEFYGDSPYFTIVQIIFHFLWDHWTHCGIFENGVLLIYTLEGKFHYCLWRVSIKPRVLFSNQ